MFDVALNPYGGGGRDNYNGHPIRVILYIHLFSHGLAEELTTEHLVQDGAVFSQIFALKYDALTTFLTRQYNYFVYASDEDFEYRKDVNKNITGKMPWASDAPVSNALEWESAYYKIFTTYASDIMQAVYGGDDANVQGDEALQKYYKALVCVFHSMPARYDEFKTVKGVTTFIADSINHLVIRHQLYGTTAVASVMDPRLGSSQTPTDGGPPAVDEWRSLVYVALATAYANFVRLVYDASDYPADQIERPLEKIFDDATPVPSQVGATKQKSVLIGDLKKAWRKLQTNLTKLQNEWVGEHDHDTDRDPTPFNYREDLNYMYFRPLPKDCHTGPGY